MSFSPASSSNNVSIATAIHARQFHPEAITNFFARAKEIINNRIINNGGAKPAQIRIVVVSKTFINDDTQSTILQNLHLLQRELSPVQIILHLNPWELKEQVPKLNIIEARINLGLCLPIKLENGELLNSQSFLRLLYSPPQSYN